MGQTIKEITPAGSVMAVEVLDRKGTYYYGAEPTQKPYVKLLIDGVNEHGFKAGKVNTKLGPNAAKALAIVILKALEEIESDD